MTESKLSITDWQALYKVCTCMQIIIIVMMRKMASKQANIVKINEAKSGNKGGRIIIIIII